MADRQALVHLRALGHRRIAYVGGPTSSWSNAERRAAFLARREEYADTELIDVGTFRPFVSGGVAAADLVIASGATAALAYDDVVAFGLLERLRQRGVRVPDDMSVVGTDNISISALTSPPLTTVGLPLVDTGRAGVDMLLSLVRDPSAPPEHHDDLALQLVVRGSTGPVDTRPAVRPA
jgi:LacI family transcriptional regulator